MRTTVQWTTHKSRFKVGAVDDDQEVRWTAELGALLQRARGPMSKREAAKRAGFSEATWRALELGVRRPAKGVVIPVNPSVGTLIAAADAVGARRAEVMMLAGVDGYDVDGDRGPTNGESADLAILAAEVSVLAERLDAVEASQQEILDELRGGRG